MVDEDDIFSVNAQLYRWFTEGRKLPGYIPGNGQPFLSEIILGEGYWGNPHDTPLGEKLAQRFEDTCPNIHRKLLGPYGWTFMRALIVDYEDRKKKEGKA